MYSTRVEQVEQDKRYRDWYKAYKEDVEKKFPNRIANPDHDDANPDSA